VGVAKECASPPARVAKELRQRVLKHLAEEGPELPNQVSFALLSVSFAYI